METPLLRRGSLAAFLALLLCGCMGEVDLAGLDSAGAPPGPPPVPPAIPPVSTCTSNTRWLNGYKGSDRMRPGHACVQCHLAEREGPRLTVAGTVYPSAHEPDDCNGLAGRVLVVIKDATGRVVQLPINGAGNFHHKEPLSPPLEAKLVDGTREIAMKLAVPTGDCNSCHTESGTSGAPGRIFLP
jgi:hypothetical protein